MIRIRPQKRIRISNRLALVGAAVVCLSLLPTTPRESDLSGSTDVSAMVRAETQKTEPIDTLVRKKRFSISRLLFGHG
jgi:hypothetical protein